MRLNRIAAPAPAALALTMSASGAAGAGTTAAEVRDNVSLRAFVEGAKGHFEAITDIDEIMRLKSGLRTEGDEEAGSPKLDYAMSVRMPNSDQKHVIGSAIYLERDGK